MSNSIKKCFLLPSPRFNFLGFQNKLSKIISEYQIDMVIPIFEETLYVGKAKPFLPKSCEVFCPSIFILNQLHNKWQFYKLQKELNFPSIPTAEIKNTEDLKGIELQAPYALKPSYSRGSIGLIQVKSKDNLPTLEIDKNNPWIAQKWITGQKYCSYSICNKGEIQAHVVYPNNVEGAGYCLSFESVEHDGIYKWVDRLVKALNYTGQISFDFVEDANKNLFAIECNPRCTSGLHLLSSNASLPNYFLG